MLNLSKCSRFKGVLLPSIHLPPTEVVESPQWAPEPVEGIEAEVAEVAEDGAIEAAEVVACVTHLSVIVVAEVATPHYLS